MYSTLAHEVVSLLSEPQWSRWQGKMAEFPFMLNWVNNVPQW